MVTENTLHYTNEYGHRLHRTPFGLLPGVTTVLSNTADKSFLDKWRKNVGEDAAKLILDSALDRGNNLHKFVEDFFNSQGERRDYPKVEIESNQVYLNLMVDSLIPYLEKIKPLFIETPTYHPLGFAGSPDCIGELDGKITVFDWKNSLKPKKKEYVVDYYLQTAAYTLSAAYTLGIKPTQTRIVVTAIEGKKEPSVRFQEFTIDDYELEMVQNAFKNRLLTYQERFKSEF